MKRKEISSLQIAGTYIGTVVGAGFGSGQEILQFFQVFGYKGLLGLGIVMFLFILLGYKIMLWGKTLRADSHLPMIEAVCGNSISKVMDYVITFFLFGSVAAMLAGSGALLHEQFGFSKLLGAILMAIIVALTVLQGINGVVNAISLVVPALILSALGISIASLLLIPKSTNSIINLSHTSGQLMGSWWWSAILYASYNILLATSILAPLGKVTKRPVTLKRGAFLGGLGLAFGALTIFIALSRLDSEIFQREIPMIYIAGKISIVVQIVYNVVLLGEIYSTAVGSLYGFLNRITPEENNKRKKMLWLIMGFSVLASQLGFSRIVQYVYPFIGYCGIVFMIQLIFLNPRRYQSKATRESIAKQLESIQ